MTPIGLKAMSRKELRIEEKTEKIHLERMD